MLVLGWCFHIIKFLRKVSDSGQQKEQPYTKDKTVLNVVLSDCTKARTGAVMYMGIVSFPGSLTGRNRMEKYCGNRMVFQAGHILSDTS